MIKATRLPEEFISGTTEVGAKRCVKPEVRKRTLCGIDEIQHLYVSPRTAIKMHGHDNQWEVWIRISQKEAYVCLKGEQHELVNDTGVMMILMAIKGHLDYSYEELESVLKEWNFTVTHGSLVAKA